MKRLLFLLASVLLSVWVSAQDRTLGDEPSVANGRVSGDVLVLPWPNDLQAQLEMIVQTDPILSNSQLGLMVYDLTDNVPIYTFNHQQSMRPASTMKLITAITALDRLGGNYDLKTSLLYSGDIVGNTLVGSLYCVGGMDPLFDINDLRDFVDHVKRMGVSCLRGSIVTDCSMKDTLRWGEGWCWDDNNPILSPLLVGGKANFVNRLIAELASGGIQIGSLTLFEDRPPLDAIPLTTCHHSLDELLQVMMKDSNNLFAECLYYQVAASFGDRPASAAHARAIEKYLVNQLGLNSDDYKFADGSGLSLYNYVTADLLVRLLRHAWTTPEINTHLLPSLPIAGVDGTLKKRMKRTVAEGNVRAKTGTLTGVSSLAGYLTAVNGHHLCFAIINHGVLNGKDARSFQDHICRVLCGEKER